MEVCTLNNLYGSRMGILKTFLATSITMVVFSDRGAGLLNVIINNRNNTSNNNKNVYILYSVRSEMGCLSITLTMKN